MKMTLSRGKEPFFNPFFLAVF